MSGGAGARAGDGKSLEADTQAQQAAAWVAVTLVLAEVAPGWASKDGIGVDLAVSAIRRLAAAPAAAPAGWISVNDRLPPKFEEVLVAFHGISLASTGQYTDNARDKHGWCYPAENYGTCDDGSDPVVTHWMPLPAAPIQAPATGDAA